MNNLSITHIDEKETCQRKRQGFHFEQRGRWCLWRRGSSTSPWSSQFPPGYKLALNFLCTGNNFFYSKFLMVTTLASFDRKCLFTWLPVLLLPDTEKDCGLGLIVSSHAVYSIPQKLRSIRTHLEDKKRRTTVLSRKTYML